jgi:hypothetical protein
VLSAESTPDPSYCFRFDNPRDLANPAPQPDRNLFELSSSSKLMCSVGTTFSTTIRSAPCSVVQQSSCHSSCSSVSDYFLSYLLPDVSGSPRQTSHLHRPAVLLFFLVQVKSSIYLLVFQVSLTLSIVGGHTSEALKLASALDFGRYSPRTYIVSEGDAFSAQKALALEHIKATHHVFSDVRNLLKRFKSRV